MSQLKIRRQILFNDILFQKIIFNETKLRYCKQEIVNYCRYITILKNIRERMLETRYLHEL